MTYIIKCITGTHSRGDFSITAGQALEVNKETYDYFNNNFGPTGYFNFETKGTKATKKVEKPVEEEKKEVKTGPKKSTKEVESK